ncbi:uncharacterized protein LOC119943432 [Tachyglossus aculeatus]|uniref:uncharacterized protein LOC119943432 n=1 Tax=Tachyglossus aculeatus TaxID=9261 RepID=UPI0018F2DE92|nr:uncharacterized protein LOC119943432 [Tachyglossus aculeatus]
MTRVRRARSPPLLALQIDLWVRAAPVLHSLHEAATSRSLSNRLRCQVAGSYQVAERDTGVEIGNYRCSVSIPELTQAYSKVSPVEVNMVSSAKLPLFEGDEEIERSWLKNYAQTVDRDHPGNNTSQSSAPFCLPELRMAPPDQAHGSGPSSALIGIGRNNDGGDGMEETEEEEKERNAAKRKRNKVVVHKTPRNRPVSKSIMEALWTTFKMKHQVRTAEAVRLAGDLAIYVPQVTAWFQSTRGKHQEMATVQKKVTKSAQDEVFHNPLQVLRLKQIGKNNSFYLPPARSIGQSGNSNSEDVKHKSLKRADFDISS